jgi:glycosyltransferase involved in cell wall biosynthesis
LILVNDGSTDSTLKVLKKYAKKYDNILIINQENQYIGGARMTGVRHSNSKYITFMDSDDCCTKDYFEKIVPIIENEQLDVLCFDYNIINNKGECLPGRLSGKHQDVEFIDKNRGLINYLNGYYSHKYDHICCNKIYLSSIVKNNNIQFYVDRDLAEDILFNLEYFIYVKKIRFLNERLYNYYLDFNPFDNIKHSDVLCSRFIKTYNISKKICKIANLENAERYIGLLMLRWFPGIILNEMNYGYYKVGKSNVKRIFKEEAMQNAIKYSKLKDMDYKVLLVYIMCKTRIFYLVYDIGYFLKKSKKRKINYESTNS